MSIKISPDTFTDEFYKCCVIVIILSRRICSFFPPVYYTAENREVVSFMSQPLFSPVSNYNSIQHL